MLGNKNPQSRKERKYTWKKNAGMPCSRNDCKYTWEKTARISWHNFETKALHTTDSFLPQVNLRLFSQAT